MRKIVLLCSAGMSTSYLVRKMEESAKDQGYDVTISAHSVSDAKNVGKEADIILLGPQIRFNLANVQEQLPNIPVSVIDMKSYGTMDGAAVIAEVKKILND